MSATLSRIALALIAGGIAIGTSGCWFYAVEYAPIGIQAATGAASAGLGAIERAVGHDPAKKGYCDSLKGDDSSVIELRTGAGRNPEYRELHVDGSGSEPRWAPVVGAETDADGWRPAINFVQMKFTPPLQDAIPTSGIRLLAYTSSESEALDNDERLGAFVHTFGQPVGTFNWGDRVYVYALPTALPCFAPPS